MLRDPEKRKKYDQLGARWREAGDFQSTQERHGRAQGAEESGQGFHFGGTGFSDFFEQYFSAGSRYGFPQDMDEEVSASTAKKGNPRRGHDIEGDVLVTLAEVMHSTIRSISLQTVNRQTGEVQTHSFQVRIPPGATDGRRIRVPGQGEPGRNGGEAGDLYLRVRHAAHPDFTTREADLYHELDAAPWEAVLGAEIVVPTLEGTLKLRVPAGTENGQTLRVRGRGLLKGKTGERGDFFVTLRVVLPTKISESERALWEQLRSASTFHPRNANSSAS